MALPDMRYEIIESAFDADGRFVGLAEASTLDDAWRSGPVRVSIGAPVQVDGVDRFEGPSPTKNQIERGLRQWAKGHAKAAQDDLAAKTFTPPVLALGVFDAQSGAKLAEPTERDPETKRKKVPPVGAP